MTPEKSVEFIRPLSSRSQLPAVSPRASRQIDRSRIFTTPSSFTSACSAVKSGPVSPEAADVLRTIHPYSTFVPHVTRNCVKSRELVYFEDFCEYPGHERASPND